MMYGLGNAVIPAGSAPPVSGSVARHRLVYVVSDPEWRRKFTEFCASQFPEGK